MKLGKILAILFLFQQNPEAGVCQAPPAIEKLIFLKKGYKAYRYKSYQIIPENFTVVDPGFAVVPSNGGLYMAGFNSWLLQPQNPLIFAASQNVNDPDSSMLVLKIDVAAKRTFLQKLTDLEKKDNNTNILISMPLGIYDFKCFDFNMIYLWGKDSAGSHLWQSDCKGLYPVFNSRTNINDVDIINENNVLMAIDSSLVMVGLQQSPKEVLKIDMEIDGVAIDKDGSVFISTYNGILKYNSLSDDDYDVITNVIHGKMRIYKNRLFVFWREQYHVIEIKLR